MNEQRLADPEVSKTLEQLLQRHPAFIAHERFIADRLAELAHRAYQHGASNALLSLMTSTQAAESTGVTRAWLTRVAARHDIGWNVGGDWVFTSDDIEQLKPILAAIPRGRPRKAQE